MPKYLVREKYICEDEYEIEAQTKDEAIQKARDGEYPLKDDNLNTRVLKHFKPSVKLIKEEVKQDGR